MSEPEMENLNVTDEPAQDSVKITLRIAGSKVVSVDKGTLMAESAYFATMFTENVKESDPTSFELELPDSVCLDTVVKLVQNLGHKSFMLSFERKDAIKVWIAAKYLQMEKVEKMTADILEDVMKRPENAFRLWRLARRRDMPDLEMLAVGAIFKSDFRGARFAQVPVSCYMEFLRCSTKEVIDLLTHDDFIAESEDKVYQTIISWCMHDPAERMQHAYRLLRECIVWDQLDIELLTASASGQLHYVLTRISKEHKRGQLGGGALLKRGGKKEAIFYHMREEHPHQLLRFDFASNELTKLDTPLQAALAECWPQIKADGFAVAIGKELVIGTKPNSQEGRDNGLMAIDCITGSRRILLEGSPFNDCMCVVAMGSQIYGAASSSAEHQLRYCYDVATRRQRRASQMHMPKYTIRVYNLNYKRASMEAVPVGRHMIFFSSVGSVMGNNSHNPVSVAEMYDVRSKKWTKFFGWDKRRHLHHRCGTIVFSGYMYITGGCVDAEEFQWDWETSSQAVATCYRVSLSGDYAHPESIANLNVARYNHCIFIKEGEIWVYGGTTHVDGDNQRKRALTSFERYDAKVNRWTVEDVPMTVELQAEVAGGDYAQKTVCVQLQYKLQAACVVTDFSDIEGSSGVNEREDTDEDDHHGTEWPAGLDD